MSSASRRLVLLAALFMYWLPASGAGRDPLEAQRAQFLAAYSALQAGDRRDYSRLKRQLARYPLYSYLEYAFLRPRLNGSRAKAIDAFLHTYADQPLAARLRQAWLHYLGKRRRWSAYLAFYTPQSSVSLQCYHLRAELAKQPGRRRQTLKQALKLWLVGHSQPDACDPLFDQLYASTLLTSEHIWKRIRLAFAHNRSSLAVWLAKRLSDEDRRWVNRWRTAARRPVQALRQPWARQDTPLVREILAHALKRLARHKPEQAWRHWRQLAPGHRFSAGQRGDVLSAIALNAALQQHPRAAEWLAQVPEAAIDARIRQWRVRTALLARDWDTALAWIEALRVDEQARHEWRYWRAVALERLGHEAAATTLYRELSTQRNFYSFLAADRLHRPYRMNDAPEPMDEAALQALAQRPGILRAHELRRLGLSVEARREWAYATADLDSRQLRLAALLAHRWRWHERAISTAAQARYWSDLALRFPLAHQDSIFTNARRQDLDPALIYGVIRQESAFMEDARSPAGALGLMQLMPSTGRQTARSLRIRYPGSRLLLQSDRNIQLGSAYFRRLLERFDHSPVLAAAAYNAGPQRIARWLPDQGRQAAVLWLNRVPYPETREYVRRVLAYATVFDWRLQRPLTRLSERMPAINGGKGREDG